mmetsp:Transcript_66321/g.138252  ORF Transcript_66321/g.138252 Transcript_66321/m.138252 type:complete len:183 (-) Transcript_66321:428-976(-)|eukprot:CAMPEP_0181316302 /NCGR_PEP_ID=MMETSP1101-20121128/15822_1 /TAXON_ID=46948 /ORGANISM="Rhodomonas abbreviata, Strain Caron Lab Isolate" /LENGTH=182 /DNA_ID=CAMNT_0023423539 /DNA_START=142 /DNA_END=690 /DNA_ORIENTATION=-
MEQSLSLKYADLQSNGCYKQGHKMACGPACASFLCKALNSNTPLTEEEHTQLVLTALQGDHDRQHPNKTIDQALKDYGFEGYGFEEAINMHLKTNGASKGVRWMSGTAFHASKASSTVNPSMLVVQYSTHEHWVVALGKDASGHLLFADPADGKVWPVDEVDVEDGKYGTAVFKQNGYYHAE